MQRLLTLVFLLVLAIPAGISFSGCTRNPGGKYCNGLGYGLKLTDVASIDLEPRTTGISLAFGQTQQITSPKAANCKGASVSVTGYTYGTTNNQLVDISPSGNLCAGVWNKRSGGGIPDYTTCIPPSPLPTTNGLPYATANITAESNSVASNVVQVFVHAQTTAVSLVLEKSATDSTVVNGCLSKGETAQLDATAFYSKNGAQAILCGPSSVGIPNLPTCATAIGTLSFASQNASVATIDPNGLITAVQPGTTNITASVANSGSSAGHFSTCPPASINVTLNGSTTGTVTQGVTQNLVTTIIDTKGNPITGLSLDYQSTNPLDISVASTAAVTANFAGQATIYAVCQPTTCNSAPIDQVGVNQTGTPITSNPVTITTPGIASDFVWLSSPKSQYFIPVELITGTIGSTVKMPYFPNSMVLDRTGSSLYFGSTTELMVYNASTNTLAKEDQNVPGKVLNVSPDNQTVLINDQVRRLFYLYKSSAGTFTTFDGVGTAAQWTPDAKTLYIVGTRYDYTTNTAGTPIPTLFVNNVNTGWTTYTLPDVAKDLAITVPSVGAFISGSPTVAHAWCPDLTPSPGYPQGQAYPLAATVPVKTDALDATTDGSHILGVGVDGTTPTLTDINVNLFANLSSGACPAANTGVTLSTPFVQSPLPFQSTAVNQVVASPASNLAFITYTASGAGTGTLPYYEPTASGALGTIGQVTLTGAPTAPIQGVFSLDDTIFFVSTAGDNKVHYIDVKSLTDTKQISPGLVDGSGNVVPAEFIAAKPRATT